MVMGFKMLPRFGLKKDVDKEDKTLFLATKLIHLIAIIAVLGGFIAITIITIVTNDNSPEHVKPFFFFYWAFTGFAIIAFTIVLASVLFHIFLFNTSRIGILFSRIVKVTAILLPTIGIVSTQVFERPLVEYLPLVAVDTIALIFMYPTKQRWIKWTKKCPTLEVPR